MKTLYSESWFTQQIHKNQNIIHKVCSVYSRCEEDRKALYQEIVLQLWKSHLYFRGEAKFTTWMYRVAINTALTIKRKDRCQLVNTEISETMLQKHLEEYDYETEEKIKILYRAIEKLGKVERAIILLWLDEKSYAEISEIIGISEKNVSVKLVRIRKKLDELIKQHSNRESHENK